MWIDLENVIQREVRKINIIYHLYVESRKMVQMNILQSGNRDTDVKNKHGCQSMEEGMG